MDAERAALREKLDRELALAETEHCRIQEEMNRILLESSDGLPFSDAQYRTMKAGVEERAAFEKYQHAVERFRALVEEGIAGLHRLFGNSARGATPPIMSQPVQNENVAPPNQASDLLPCRNEIRAMR